MDCVFCRILAGTEPCEKVYEDEHTIAFLDIAQATEGHSLVVPREHCADLYDIGEERAAQVMRASVRVAELLTRALEPAGMNLFQASRPAAWQTVYHFHMHVVPRYGFGDLNLPWIPSPKPVSSLAGLGERIRAAT